MRASLFAAGLIALSATSALADPLAVTATRESTIGVDGALVVPVGDYANVATVGFGALARVEIPAGAGFVTGRTGLIAHDSRVDSMLTVVPFYAGYRLPLGTAGAYLAGEIGISVIFATVDTSFGRMSASDSKLGLTLGGGLKRGALDLRAGLFSPDVNNAVGLIGTVGFDFAAF